MNNDEIKEIFLLSDNDTKLLEWLEDHPEESEKLIEAVNKFATAVGEAMTKIAEQLSPTITAVANLAAATLETERIEEKTEEDSENENN